MRIFENRYALQQYLDSMPAAHFVPTMGALHAGHLSLVEAARKGGGTVAVSIFVNPTQFNDPLDLERYPRTLDADFRLLDPLGVDAVFIPSVKEIYPEPDMRRFDFGQLDKVMEGATRPGHFNGVAQVVSRLFEIVRPAAAYFGEKDFQQIAIIRAMVKQLELPVKIVACPTVREPDGLAMSSRNTLLNNEQRAAAPLIYATLAEAAALRTTLDIGAIERWVVARINQNPYLETVYFRIVDAGTLLPVTDRSVPGEKRGCIAVKAGDIRLIDNIDFGR